MVIRSIVVACAVALGAGVSVAQAANEVATLGQVAGKVMVNKGKGFTAAKAGMGLANNDRLITLDGGSASVVYMDGCTTNVKPNSVLAISGAAGCKAQALSVYAPAPTTSQPIRFAAVGDTKTDGTIETVTATGKWVWIGGALVFVAAVNNSSSDNDPISGQ